MNELCECGEVAAVFFDDNKGRELESPLCSGCYAELYEIEEKEFPVIVCLCGSTRFWREFQAASLRETLAGKIVLSIGAASGTDDDHFGNLPRDEYDRIKAKLDELHLRKIDLAEEVLILNVGGYIGESTRRELNYAINTGKTVRFLKNPTPGDLETSKRRICPDCGANIINDGGTCFYCETREI